jgi:O-antigen/teichoic acid export membrane protein
LYTVAILQREGVMLFGRHRAAAPAIDRRVILRFVAAGNLLGYVKLLHRSADVLLVAAFCGDRGTGIYKLARSITDALLTVSEAIGRVYQPRLLALLQARDHAEYGAVVRSIMMTAAAITFAAIGGALALLPSLAPLLGVTDGSSLTLSVVIMTLTFFFIAGLQSWIWPVFVSSGQMGRCTLWGAVAVLAGQYTIGPALVYLTGNATPTWFSLGYLSFYVLSVLPLWRELRRDRTVFTWPVQEAATL